MRAIFKFPALRQPVLQGDGILLCLKIQTTYDGMPRIAIHVGAFRFVCTNLPVGAAESSPRQTGRSTKCSQGKAEGGRWELRAAQ